MKVPIDSWVLLLENLGKGFYLKPRINLQNLFSLDKFSLVYILKSFESVFW